MQLGEPLAIGVLSDIKHDEDCYFCKHKDPPQSMPNELTDQADEDEETLENSMGEYKFKNDAGKLGNALGGKPEARTVSFGSSNYDAAVAAHHLIPGNASLKNSQIMAYLHKDGTATGNIAYNVNSAPNGVWLVGNYGVRPWGAQGTAFEKQSGQTAKEFAFRAMEAWRCQFHDAHGEYSDQVSLELDKIADKLRKQGSIWCPESKDKDSKDHPPFYALVSRLNTVSARLRRMLEFPTTSWQVNIYTSAWVQDYVIEKPHQT